LYVPKSIHHDQRWQVDPLAPRRPIAHVGQLVPALSRSHRSLYAEHV